MAVHHASRRVRRLTVERLEGRDNPAVTVALTPAGALTITGGDTSSDLTVDFSTGVVTSASGETINSVGVPGVVTSVAVNLFGGDDTVRSAVNTDLKTGTAAVSINLGDGDNRLLLDTLDELLTGPITYTGGDGSDIVTIQPAASSNVAGAVTVKAGEGDLTLTVRTAFAAGLPISGGVAVTNSSGNTTVTLDRANPAKVSVFGGAVGSEVYRVATTLTDSDLGGPLTVTGAPDILTDVRGGRVKGVTVKSSAAAAMFSAAGINFDGVAVPTGNIAVTGAGRATVSIDQSGVVAAAIGNVAAASPFEALVTLTGGGTAGANQKTAGAVSAKASNNQDAHVAIRGMTAVGAVSANASAGGEDAVVRLTDVTAVGPVRAMATRDASVQLTDVTAVGPVRATATGDVSLNLVRVQKTGAITAAAQAEAYVSLRATTTGDANTKSGGHVTVSGRSAIFDAIGGAAVVNGNLTAKGTIAGADIRSRFAGTALTVRGTTTMSCVSGRLDFNIGAGADDATFFGPVWLTTTGPASEATITLLGDQATFEKALTVRTASCFANFGSARLTEIKGDFSMTGGAGYDSLRISPTFRAKNFKWDAKAGASVVNIGTRGAAARATVTGNFTFVAGAGSDTLAIDGLTVGGLTAISTGTGGDAVTVNNSTFSAACRIDAGAGDDTVRVAYENGAANRTNFLGLTTIALGAGNDEVILGNSIGDAATEAFFGVLTSKADGGAGFDIRNTTDTNLPSPRFVNFEFVAFN